MRILYVDLFKMDEKETFRQDYFEIHKQANQSPNQLCNLPPWVFENLPPGSLNQNDRPKENINRGTWSPQEDEQLTNPVNQIGQKNWVEVAKHVPARTAKQCRERWRNRLRPNLNLEPFQYWEDQIIIEKQKEIGNRCALMAKQLPGRSSNAIKNRWYSTLRHYVTDNT